MIAATFLTLANPLLPVVIGHRQELLQSDRRIPLFKMSTALLWVVVLCFTQLLDVSAKVVGENRLTQDVELLEEQQRIVGGQKAYLGQFPYDCALHFDGQFICTCSMLSERWILTAAHCVVLDGRQQPPSRFTANYRTTKRSVQTYRTSFIRIVSHPQYSDQTLQADIAVMQTTAQLKFDQYANKVCLTTACSCPSGWGTASGWGRMFVKFLFWEYQKLPEDLYYVELKSSSLSACQEVYGSFVDECHVCMESPDSEKKGVCQGDSGGPLVCRDSQNEVFQVGVASFVHAQKGCGYANMAGSSVYTCVACYLPWLLQTANDSDICVV